LNLKCWLDVGNKRTRRHVTLNSKKEQVLSVLHGRYESVLTTDLKTPGQIFTLDEN
jgi:hypothetical protein